MKKQDVDETERKLLGEESHAEDPQKKAKQEIREEKLAIKAVNTEVINSKRRLLAIKMQIKTLTSNLEAMHVEGANNKLGKTELEIEAKVKEQYNKYLCDKIPYLS